jgi:hypothetical protein
MDIYDVKWMDPRATAQQRWSYSLSRQMGTNELVQFTQRHGKRVSYPEWGLYKSGDSFAGGGDNPYFMQQMADLIKRTNPVYQSYFNLDWGGGVLQQFSQGQSAYKQLFSVD